MKVFVTGATGYIGSAVAEALARAGHQVLALARSDEAEKRLAARGYAALRGDMRDAARIADAARSAEATVHAATTGTPENAELDAVLTRAVLAALEGSGKPFVYTSGVWSLGDTGEGVADETSVPAPIPKVAWRIPVERDVLAAAARGVRSVVLRPTIVYGRAGGIPGSFVVEARERGAVRVVGTGLQEWSGVHLDDLADLYVRALGAAPGSMLHGTAGPTYRVRDIAIAASLAAGAGGRVEPWPLEEARKEVGDYADALALHQHVSGLATRKALGWRPEGPSMIEDLLVGSYAKGG